MTNEQLKRKLEKEISKTEFKIRNFRLYNVQAFCKKALLRSGYAIKKVAPYVLASYLIISTPMFNPNRPFIKETSYEINYLIESICNLEDNENNRTNLEPYLLYIYETLSLELREITIKTMKCIKEQNSNEILRLYQEEFENKKDSGKKQSIFISIKEAFENIYKNLIPNHDNSEKEPQYNKLKTTLESICGDLFSVVEECKYGRFNMRKIRAISHEKVEIIKLVMNCDYLIYNNKKLKEAIHTLELVKLD